jgi:hypothetical protein
MGRRPKKQFSFPSTAEPVPTDAELDAAIDGTEAVVKEIKKDSAKKSAVAQAIKEIPQIFTPEQVAFVFDLYVGLLCFIYAFIFKCDFKPLFEELKFDEAEKMTLAKPLAKIASKYAPSEWAGMSAEIELCASIGMYTVMSFKRAELVAKREKEKQRKEEEAKRRTFVDARSNQPQREAVAVTS